MTAAAPALPAHTPTSRLYRIAELMIRYRPAERAGKWRILDVESGNILPAEYSDEGLAKAGARLNAAADIEALYDERGDQ